MSRDTPRAPNLGSGFSKRILTYFSSQVATGALGIFNGFVLAAQLGPSLKGDYYLLVLLPSTLMVLIQFGLPQAFGFFSARGMTHGLVGRTLVLTGVISLPVMLAMLAAGPILNTNLLKGIEPALVVVSLLTLPLLLSATLTTGIIVGRQGSHWLAAVGVCVSLLVTPLIVLFVGVLGLGLWGAILVFIIGAAVRSAGMLVGAKRLATEHHATGAISSWGLLRYGLPFYPASLSQFLGYRADVYLLVLLLADPSAPLGYYSMAVAMAEMVFYLPNAVSTFFFPHVASSSRIESDGQVAMVSRVTLLLTSTAALALLPVAVLSIIVIIPSFEPALPALLVILPGVVALSVTKVLTGYLAGIDRAGMTSLISITTFLANVVLNLLLIPRFGIVGASMASLLSYSLSSVVYSLVAARLSGADPIDFWVPRLADIRLVITTMGTLVRQTATKRLYRG